MNPIENIFMAGAAGLNVDPPLGLPMLGVVRRDQPAKSRLGPLEVTACAIECGSTRVILCGVDTLAIQSPEVDDLREKIARKCGAERAGVVLNWNHTHHAPPGCRSLHGFMGDPAPAPSEEVLAYVNYLHSRIIEVCHLACERLEPAWMRWGLGHAPIAINRRQRDNDGQVRIIGWNPEGLVDQSVPVLQAVRRDGSAIATVVSYGCHTVTTRVNYIGYSPDYPGPLRDFVRKTAGGECIFLQGAGGNVMPLIAFEESGEAMKHHGQRLGIEALRAIADQPGWPAKLKETGFSSGTPLTLFRWEPVEGDIPHLSATEETIDFPLLPLPTLEEITELLVRAEEEYDIAVKSGATEPELRILRFHGLGWARRTEAEIRSGKPRTSVRGSISAIRIGNGAIVTGPGEIFNEIGLAVKERSPAEVTLYAGYSNGAISYFPTAAEYPIGGYEPTYGNKTYGLPMQVSPDCERLLIETGVRLVCALFPDRKAPDVDGWMASGNLPKPPKPRSIERPTVSSG